MNEPNDNKRISIAFHDGNEEEMRAYGYVISAKTKGRTFVQYVTECVLKYEEGPSIKLSKAELDSLPEKIADEMIRRQHRFD